MTTQDRWLCLSVDEFLNQSNWEGKIFTEPLQVNSPDRNSSQDWQLFSVKDFFNNSNWSGKVSVKYSTAGSDLLEPSSYLTTSVAKFFKLIPWEEGQEVILFNEPVIEIEPPSPPPKAYTIDDFAELF